MCLILTLAPSDKGRDVGTGMDVGLALDGAPDVTALDGAVDAFRSEDAGYSGDGAEVPAAHTALKAR